MHFSQVRGVGDDSEARRFVRHVHEHRQRKNIYIFVVLVPRSARCHWSGARVENSHCCVVLEVLVIKSRYFLIPYIIQFCTYILYINLPFFKLL